jgi:hypothetical protein
MKLHLLRKRGSHAGDGDKDSLLLEDPAAPPAAPRPPVSPFARMETLPPALERTGPNPVMVPRPAPEPCRCDECTRHCPGTGVVLYAGPDAVSMLTGRALRDGWYEDVEAYALDTAPLNVHLPAVQAIRRINRRIAGGQRTVLTSIAASPDVRYDPELAEGLHAAEAVLEERLSRMRLAAAEREEARQAGTETAA